MGWWSPRKKKPYPSADDHLFNPKPGFRKRKYSIYLNEKIPFLDAIDDFSPTFSPTPHFTPWNRRAGPMDPMDTTRRTPRVGRKNRTARPFAPGPTARPSSPTDHCTNTGLLASRRTVLPQIGMSIFSISMKLYFFWGYRGTSILTHIQMWKLVHKCLVC